MILTHNVRIEKFRLESEDEYEFSVPSMCLMFVGRKFLSVHAQNLKLILLVIVLVLQSEGRCFRAAGNHVK